MCTPALAALFAFAFVFTGTPGLFLVTYWSYSGFTFRYTCYPLSWPLARLPVISLRIFCAIMLLLMLLVPSDILISTFLLITVILFWLWWSSLVAVFIESQSYLYSGFRFSISAVGDPN